MKTNKHIEEVLRSIHFIEDQLLSEINVRSVCDNSNFSPWEFQRIFRAITGDSIGNYIRGRRLTLAAYELRKNKKKRILDISLQYNFGSQEAFTRAFKSQFNLTPGQARRENKVFSIVKPKLNMERLKHISNHVGKEPEIKTLGKKMLVGLAKEVSSTLGKDIETHHEIVEHWNHFNSIKKELKAVVTGKSYGVMSSADGFMEDEKLTYLASVEVGDEFKNASVKYRQEVIKEEQIYAFFEMRGNQKSCQMTADYAYGIWLPQSEFVRAEGPDVEIFDHRLYPEEGISHYCLPLKK